MTKKHVHMERQKSHIDWIYRCQYRRRRCLLFAGSRRAISDPISLTPTLATISNSFPTPFRVRDSGFYCTQSESVKRCFCVFSSVQQGERLDSTHETTTPNDVADQPGCFNKSRMQVQYFMHAWQVFSSCWSLIRGIGMRSLIEL